MQTLTIKSNGWDKTHATVTHHINLWHVVNVAIEPYQETLDWLQKAIDAGETDAPSVEKSIYGQADSDSGAFVTIWLPGVRIMVMENHEGVKELIKTHSERKY